MSLAPIALFVYSRPEHTRRTLASLAANEGAADSELYVFADGAKNEAAVAGVTAVRELLRGIHGFKRVELIERDSNFGLARSIIDGVTRLCAEQGRVIVVEDDLICSRYFLRFLNDGLDAYADTDEVASIHAFLPPLLPMPTENFFLYGADCWGWATWQRAWRGFEPDGRKLLERIATHPRRGLFDYIGKLPHTSMLRGFLAGRNNSWAIRWHASMFLAGKLTLHPARTLVNNIGLDGSGTHCSDNDDMNSTMLDAPLPVTPIPLQHSQRMWRAWRRYYATQMARRLWRKVFR